MKPYNDWLEIARRWDACVDFASPMSAWTPAMWATYRRRVAAKEAGATHVLWRDDGLFEYYLDGLTEISVTPEGVALRGRRWSQEIADQYQRREL